MGKTNKQTNETGRTGFLNWFAPAALIVTMTAASWTAAFVVVHDFVQTATSAITVSAEANYEAMGR